MGIIENMFKWLTAKDKHGKDLNVGYVLDSEPKTIEDFEKVFKAFNLQKYFQTIIPLAKPSIELELMPGDESEFTVIKSQVGGKPHLVKNQEWPKDENEKSLSFICQLNFEEISQFDESNLLPKQGLLSFFYCSEQEAWGFDPKDKNRFKVLYSENANDHVKREFPKDLESHSIFSPNKVSYDSSLSIPTWEDDSIEGLIKEKDWDNYMEASRGLENQILGYANCIQAPMELECQLVTNGLFCGDSTGYEDPKRNELEAGKNDWVLLLQIGSDEEKTGMMFGDGGKIYFWIRKEDLIKKDFDKTWCILQCY